MNARTAGRGAETYICCEATNYPLIYGDRQSGLPRDYVVESREDTSRTEAIYIVSYVGTYESEPEQIAVRRTRYGEVKVAEIRYLGD